MKYYYRSIGYPTRNIANNAARDLSIIKGVYFSVFKCYSTYYFDNTYDPDFLTANRGIN